MGRETHILSGNIYHPLPWWGLGSSGGSREEQWAAVDQDVNGNEQIHGRDWGQEEKGMTEDEMAGWHH